MVRLDAERALVQTVDFFTPIVDDAYLFGQIAAANALSDVYAMGGEVLSALNIVCFPDKQLPPEILQEILRGGADKLTEAGGVLAGGHSVKDAELKYGMAVTGLVHPDRIWTNTGARPGDVLVLTKPIGTGILSTAVKRDVFTDDALLPAVHSMCLLNRDAKRAAAEGDVHGGTDVTGFGLAGHAWEVAAGSGVRLRISWGAVPLLPRTEEAARLGCIPGGTKGNRRHLGAHLAAPELDEVTQWMASDAQTSGGLLLSVPRAHGEALAKALPHTAVIGEVEAGEPVVLLEP